MNDKLKIVFKYLVEEYIDTAKPVSSNILVSKYNLPFSPATIRNYMMALEASNYIEKNHFASGRVPTSKGYRFYVFNLMSDDNKESSTKKKLDNVFQNRSLTINEIIEKSCEILSDLTNLATAKIDTTSTIINSNNLKKVEFIPISKSSAVSIIITNDGKVENKVVEIPSNLDIKDIQICINYINERMENYKIADIYNNLEFIKKIIKNHITTYEQNLEFIIRKLLTPTYMHKNNLPNVYGVSKVVSFPDFDDLKKIKMIVKVLEDNSIWEHIKSSSESESWNDNHDIKLSLGEDLSPDLDEIAILSSPYKINDQSGEITIVGPKRMNYKKITTLLKWLSKKIEELNSSQKE